MSDADPKEVELSAESTEGAEKGAKASTVPIKYASHPFPGFKPYPERGMTDCLCVIIFIIFFLGWMGMLAVGILKGKPEIITHSTDYEGNVCGFQSKAGNSWDKGTAPKDIMKANKGVFPRMVDDFLRLLPGDNTVLPSVSDISITTFCAEKCPDKGEVFCTYKFAHKQNVNSPDKGWADSPLTGDAKSTALLELLKTATLSRDKVANDVSSLNAVCSTDLCKDIFYNCDATIIDTRSVMNRCIPHVEEDKPMQQERCINPLKTTNCSTAQSSPDYWKKCANGKQVEYECEPNNKGDKCLISKVNRKRCKEVESLREVTSLAIPQADMTTKLLKKLQSFSKYVQDVRTAAGPVAVCGMIFAVVCGFLFLVVIGRIAGCFVWTTIILTEICFIAIAILSLFRGGIIREADVPTNVASLNDGSVALGTSAEYEDYYKVAAGVFVFLSVLFLTIIVFLRKKIVEAVKVIKISANAVTENYKIVFWPIISFIFIGAFTVLFILIGCLLMASADELEIKPDANATEGTMEGAFLTVQSYTADETLKYLAAYDLFMWLWFCELVQAIGIFVIGGTITKWYFTPKGTKQEDLGNTSRCARCQEGGISGAFCITMRKHFGTAAFGALVIAVIQSIRICVAYMLKQMEQGPDNRLMKCLKGCVSCCLGCFEKCAKYLSRNAYIYTSIHGTSFCYSSYKSFVTIFNNLLRFGATGLSSALIMLFGKLFVTFASTIACYLWLDRGGEYNDRKSEKYIDQKGTMFVCAVVAVMAFIVAEVFFNVYEITSDSIMLSYCLDVDEGGAAYKDKLGEDYEVKKAPEDEHEDEIDKEENKKFCCGCK